MLQFPLSFHITIIPALKLIDHRPKCASAVFEKLDMVLMCRIRFETIPYYQGNGFWLEVPPSNDILLFYVFLKIPIR